MPTLTFYTDEETARKLDRLLKRLSRQVGVKVSRGDLFVPYIKSEYNRLFNNNGSKAVTTNEPVKEGS